jgi:hypothetical protein
VRKKKILVYAATSLLILISMGMLLAESINLEVLFSLWLIAILIITEIMDPVFSQPRYVSRQTWFLATGILLFGLIIIRKVQVILSR